MPATEQTWRNLKTLHVAFGASALIMLLVSVWMLASDHNREAKGLQKEFSVLESRYLEWRRGEQLTTDYENEEAKLKKTLEDAQAAVPPQAEVDRFLGIAEQKPDNKYNLDAVEKA